MYMKYHVSHHLKIKHLKFHYRTSEIVSVTLTSTKFTNFICVYTYIKTHNSDIVRPSSMPYVRNKGALYTYVAPLWIFKYSKYISRYDSYA